MNANLTVLVSGRAAITDLGRFGSAHLGIPSNGASDQYSARVANILVGNLDSAPLIQMTAADFSFRTDVPILLAVTGAPTRLFVDGVEVPSWSPVCVPASARVDLRTSGFGMHAYLAVKGDMSATFFRGSCAPDSLLVLGCSLQPGGSIKIESDYRPFVHPYLPQPLFAFSPHIPIFAHAWNLDVLTGPEAVQFEDSIKELTESNFTVDARSDHVGTRLDGPTFNRSIRTEILSRGVPLGAIEVPPSGALIALQRGRPITAGYPVIAVVTRASRDALGQLRPGDSVQFQFVTRASAIEKNDAVHRRLDTLRQRVSLAFDSVGMTFGTTKESVQL